MTAWFRLEMHVMGGTVVKSDITEKVAREMLADEHRYIFHDPNLPDREKVARMLSTQVAFAVEKSTGMFVLDGVATDADKWLVPNANILAVKITDLSGGVIESIPVGELETLTKREVR